MMATDRSKLPPHKREELRRKEEEKELARLHSEFVEEFSEQPTRVGKAFVRGEVVNPEQPQHGVGAGRLYKPNVAAALERKARPEDETAARARKLAEIKAKQIMAEARAMGQVPQMERPPQPVKAAATRPSRMTNLEAFKEELKVMQEAREERRKVRTQLREQLGADSDALDRIAPSLDNPYMSGSYDHDPNTTNLFLSNLSPQFSQEDLNDMFGMFGPLASSKIMWPRTDDERSRGYNCGFVAYMTRQDADRAVAAFQGREINGWEVKMSFAKPVPIPTNPIYVPPIMMKTQLPPLPTGLPFNAIGRDIDRQSYKGPIPRPGQQLLDILAKNEHLSQEKRADMERQWKEIIKNATVRVVIPTERQLLTLIHRVCEFVVREGPVFEAMIMNREISNPLFRFLFDNQSPAHVYYRWKLFSLLNGDQPNKWSERPFKMFRDGSTWYPPPFNYFQKGMPEELYDQIDKMFEQRFNCELGNVRRRSTSPDGSRPDGKATTGQRQSRSRSRSRSGSTSRSSSPLGIRPAQSSRIPPGEACLSDRRRDQLEDTLRSLVPDRKAVADAMAMCVSNADCALEVVECVAESLSLQETPLFKKIARLYLVSDILSNCTARVPNVTFYRKFFYERMEEIFNNLRKTSAQIEGRLRAEQFKQRVMQCFRAWEEQALYPTDFLIRLQNIFLGLYQLPSDQPGSSGAESPSQSDAPLSGTGPMGTGSNEHHVSDLDGVPLEEAAADGGGQSVLQRLVGDYGVDDQPVEYDSSLSPERSNLPPAAAAAATEVAAEPKTDKKSAASGGFVKSKWEELDPDVVEKQAMTTSKWDLLGPGADAEHSNQGPISEAPSPVDDDLDGVPMDSSEGEIMDNSNATPDPNSSRAKSAQMSETRRKALRDIEVKVMAFQDDLESGKKMDSARMQAEVDKYRKELLSKLPKDGSPSPTHSKNGRAASGSAETGRAAHSHHSTVSSSASKRHGDKKSGRSGGKSEKRAESDERGSAKKHKHSDGDERRRSIGERDRSRERDRTSRRGRNSRSPDNRSVRTNDSGRRSRSRSRSPVRKRRR